MTLSPGEWNECIHVINDLMPLANKRQMVLLQRIVSEVTLEVLEAEE